MTLDTVHSRIGVCGVTPAAVREYVPLVRRAVGVALVEVAVRAVKASGLAQGPDV